MWLWLPKRLNKRHLFVLQIVGLILFIHCTVLIAYFFCLRSPVMTIKMNVALLDLSRPITIVPFVKRTGQLAKLMEKKSATQTQKSVNKKVHKPLKRVEPQKKAIVVKQEKSIRNVFKKEPVPKKLLQPLTPEVKKEQPPVVAVAQKKEEIIQKIPLLIPEEKGEEKLPESVMAVESDEPIVLGQEEFEALQIYQEVHAELSKNWHPPAGLHPKNPTILLLSIGQSGEVIQTVVEQASGILVYDIAARMAIAKAIFPPKLWNQQIRLHF